jgi:CHAT domain-containing protein
MLLLDDLASRRAGPRVAEQQHRLLDMNTRLNQLDRKITALLGKKDGLATSSQQFEELAQERNAVQAQAAQMAAEWSRSEVFTLEQVQAHLPADAALLAWVDVKGDAKAVNPSGEHWACIVRRTGGPVWVPLAGSGPGEVWTKDDNALPRRVAEAMDHSPTEVMDGSRELLRRLAVQRLAPVEAHLADWNDLPAVGRLIVLPAGWMAGIPVEALTDRYLVSYAPSGTVLARLAESRRGQDNETRQPGKETDRSTNSGLLALGDPVYQRPGETGGPQSLPGSRREVEAIARLFEGATLLLGSEASEQRLDDLAAKDQLRKYRYVHLATHGMINAQNARQSALLLSRDHLPDLLGQIETGRKAYKGQLTVDEIMHRWQLNAELVTLSACQTGLGQEGGGDGFLGFGQALLLAGAHSMVVSLWQVDDTATTLLMTRFYENLLGKRAGLKAPLPKAEALREAKSWLANLSAKDVDSEVQRLPQVRGSERKIATEAIKASKPFEHPYYWAAFVLIGDPH